MIWLHIAVLWALIGGWLAGEMDGKPREAWVAFIFWPFIMAVVLAGSIYLHVTGKWRDPYA